MATILIVEDHPVTQRVLTYTLQKLGHGVILAVNGREALDRLAETPVDLVISDIAMPEMDGMTLLKHMRADVRYQALPVVVLTASGQDHDLHEARAAGANAFLTKPTSSRELAETVGRLLP
jgi:CheY-like chemotaxis protein